MEYNYYEITARMQKEGLIQDNDRVVFIEERLNNDKYHKVFHIETMTRSELILDNESEF